MTTTNLRTENQLRQGFKVFNRFMLLMWRLGLGPMLNFWPEVGGRIMVLAHTGRKTGRRRYTPVNYTLADGELYCTAAFSASDWYRNIQAHPEVEVWLPDGRWAGRAEDVPDGETRIPLMRQLMIDTGFAARAAGVDPVSMSNQELAAATATYRLVHIRRSAARTGPGGPGDLAWVWPLATFILLPFVLFRRKRQRG
jgi:deazaflavin-dependent oxidoreductase (nitroreductase family)